MLDAEHGGVSKHLGQIADAMYEWEGPIAEQLELTRADVAAIKTEHQNKLRLQTLVVLSYFLLSPPQFTLSLSLSLRRAALEKWKQKLGSDATYNNLIRVFEQAEYKDLADFVRNIAGS